MLGLVDDLRHHLSTVNVEKPTYRWGATGRGILSPVVVELE